MSYNSRTIQIHNLKCAIQEIKNGGRKENKIKCVIQFFSIFTGFYTIVAI